MLLRALSLALCAFPLRAQSVHYTLQGTEADPFRSDVVDLSDLDGDGVRELAIGLPAATGSSGPGQILLVSGRDGTPLHTIHGTSGTGSIGRALSALGDLDGDVRDELGTVAPNGVGTGGGIVVLSSVSGATLWSADVPPVSSSGLLSIGDIDGDGFSEVLFGDRQQLGGGVGSGAWISLGPGQVRLYSGRDGTQLRSESGQQPLGQWGRYLAAPGDIDADGVPDYAFSTWVRLTFVSGATGERIRNWNSPWGLGEVAVADLDQDGRRDFVFGGPSRATAVSTSTWTELWTVVRPFTHLSQAASPGLVPSTAVSIGDVDGDGVEDLVLGYDDRNRYSQGPGAHGLIYQGPGQVLVVSGVDGSTLSSFTGTAMDQGYGGRVGSLGDIDADGTPEIWVVSPRARSGDAVVGSLEVRSALDRPAQPESYCVAGVNASGTAARLSVSGTTSVANNDLVFHVTGGEPQASAILLYGRDVGARLFGRGTLCIADDVFRARGGTLDAQGNQVFALDLSSLWSQAPITAGSLWSFQVWYRSPGSAGSGWSLSGVNLSDAMRVPFTP